MARKLNLHLRKNLSSGKQPDLFSSAVSRWQQSGYFSLQFISSLIDISRLKAPKSTTLYEFSQTVVNLVNISLSEMGAFYVRFIYLGNTYETSSITGDSGFVGMQLYDLGTPVGEIEIYTEADTDTLPDAEQLYSLFLFLEVLAEIISVQLGLKPDNRISNQTTHPIIDRLSPANIINDNNQSSDNDLNKIRSSISKIILPMIDNLMANIDNSNSKYLEGIKTNLLEITSPIVSRLESQFSDLTPRETEVCNLIRNGMSSKEIADALNVSVHTINNQRRRIRKKLQIADNETNLEAFLNSL